MLEMMDVERAEVILEEMTDSRSDNRLGVREELM
jgi:hypothetical protein